MEALKKGELKRRRRKMSIIIRARHLSHKVSQSKNEMRAQRVVNINLLRILTIWPAP